MADVQTIGREEIAAMLRGAAAQIEAQRDMLSRLDSFGGDGDHGTTMARAMGLVVKTLDEVPEADANELLTAVGWAVMGVDGGATGPLFGMFFMSMAGPAAGKDAIDAPTLAAMFEAGLSGVRKQTRAAPGDKTMLDALIPAVGAFRSSADAGVAVDDALRQAADAAKAGAAATSEMQARFGRAKNIGEKSVGNPDPGATSVSLMFQGFWEGVHTNA